MYCGATLFFWRMFDIRPGSNTPNLITMSILSVTILSAAYSKPNLSLILLRGNDISYGIYIYHMVFVNMAFELAYPPTFGLGVTVMTITVLAAMLSWSLVERPALGLKGRLGSRLGHPTTATARAAAVP